MIARIWHGTVSTERVQEYCELVKTHEIPEIRGIAGNQGVQMLLRSEGPLTHLLVVSYWNDREAIKAFTGDDISLAKYYPHDKDYLLEFETHVTHYEIVAEA